MTYKKLGRVKSRFLKIGLLCAMFIFLIVLPAAATDIDMYIGQNEMWVDGQSVPLDAAPYIQQDRTMVPLSAIATAFGAHVTADYYESGLEAEIDYRNVKLFLLLGDRGAHYINEAGNDTVVSMDVAPELRNDRMFVPVSFIARGFGAKVSWDPYLQNINIQQ
ncbi:MAG TPA: copper amine oxidase N-terminal domain-containing protein [Syntrophomonadaceae bacterium]|nr:copper amine oxidase N-terminal domain-containing protein [Syntrophomonadaceae bacterium]